MGQHRADADGGGAGSVPAGWYPDPFKRHEYRWWAGTIFTDTVSDRGVVTTEPQRIPQPWWLLVVLVVALTVLQILALSAWNTPGWRGNCPNELITAAGAAWLTASWTVAVAGLLVGQWWDGRHRDMRRRFPFEVIPVFLAFFVPGLMIIGILLCGL